MPKYFGLFFQLKKYFVSKLELGPAVLWPFKVVVFFLQKNDNFQIFQSVPIPGNDNGSAGSLILGQRHKFSGPTCPQQRHRLWMRKRNCLKRYQNKTCKNYEPLLFSRFYSLSDFKCAPYVAHLVQRLLPVTRDLRFESHQSITSLTVDNFVQILRLLFLKNDDWNDE